MVLPARDIALNLRFFGLFKERDLVWWFRSSLTLSASPQANF
jgi:hypothetical protein